MEQKGIKEKTTGLRVFKKCLILMMICIESLTACGGTGTGPESKPGETDQVFYEIRETAVPNPDEALADLEKGDGEIYQFFEMDYLFGGDRLYRLVRLYIMDEGAGANEEGIVIPREVRYYLQVLDPPYEEWKSYRITASQWDADAEYEFYTPDQIIAAEKNRVYLKVYYNGDHADYLGMWSEDGSGGLLGVLPEELQDMTLVMGNGKAVGAYSKYQDSLMLLGGEPEGVQVRGRVTASGNVLGALWDPKGERLLWYGLNEDRRSGVRQAEDNAEVILVPEGRGNIGLAACSEEGVLYLANNQELWRCRDKGELEALFRFSDLDYFVEDLHGMSVQAEDVLLLLAWYEGKDHVLQVKKAEGVVREQQKILLAVSQWTTPRQLKQAITQFNRQNREYRVEVLEPEEGESGYEFLDRIQREMIAGGAGPDLIFGLPISEKARDFVRNGYLQEVSDFLPEKGVLWQAAVENGVIDGRQYGIPYECRLRFATYSRDLTGDRDSWNLDEMMEAVRNSGAEVLQAGASSMDIVMCYGLYDNDNRKFIDWEKGESHLDEASFLDFLAFVKEYTDREVYSGNPYTDPDTRLPEGKVAAKWDAVDMQELRCLNELYASFQGKPAFIGFPREEGNGIYVMSSCFYVSSLTKQREGCKAFLDFLLSEEAQKSYVEFRWRDELGGEFQSPGLAVRLSALEHSIQLKKQEKISGETLTVEGIPYFRKGFGEEQEEAFRFLLENARPANWRVQEIEGIVYEELVPYFAGQRTAEEAAGLLHNRVQLYLDENK